MLHTGSQAVSGVACRLRRFLMIWLDCLFSRKWVPCHWCVNSSGLKIFEASKDRLRVVCCLCYLQTWKAWTTLELWRLSIEVRTPDIKHSNEHGENSCGHFPVEHLVQTVQHVSISYSSISKVIPRAGSPISPILPRKTRINFRSICQCWAESLNKHLLASMFFECLPKKQRLAGASTLRFRGSCPSHVNELIFTEIL